MIIQLFSVSSSFYDVIDEKNLHVALVSHVSVRFIKRFERYPSPIQPRNRNERRLYHKQLLDMVSTIQTNVVVAHMSKVEVFVVRMLKAIRCVR